MSRWMIAVHDEGSHDGCKRIYVCIYDWIGPSKIGTVRAAYRLQKRERIHILRSVPVRTKQRSDTTNPPHMPQSRVYDEKSTRSHLNTKQNNKGCENDFKPDR